MLYRSHTFCRGHTLAVESMYFLKDKWLVLGAYNVDAAKLKSFKAALKNMNNMGLKIAEALKIGWYSFSFSVLVHMN